MMVQYDPKVSLGTLLEIFVLLMAGLAAYFALEGRVTAVEVAQLTQKETNAAIKNDIKEVATEVKKLNDNLTNYLINDARTKR